MPHLTYRSWLITFFLFVLFVWQATPLWSESVDVEKPTLFKKGLWGVSAGAFYRDWTGGGEANLKGLGSEWTFLYGNGAPRYFWALGLHLVEGPFNRSYKDQHYDLWGIGESLLIGVPMETRLLRGDAISGGVTFAVSSYLLQARSYDAGLTYGKEDEDVTVSYSNKISEWNIELGGYLSRLTSAREDTGSPESLLTRNDGWMLSVAYLLPVSVFYRAKEGRMVDGKQVNFEDRSRYDGWGCKMSLTLFLGI